MRASRKVLAYLLVRRQDFRSLCLVLEGLEMSARAVPEFGRFLRKAYRSQ